MATVAPGAPADWDSARDQAEGAYYRARFLDTHKRTVHELRERLRHRRAEAQKAEQRLAHLRRCAVAAGRELAARAPDGADVVENAASAATASQHPTSSGSRSTWSGDGCRAPGDSADAAPGSPRRRQKVCSRCSADVLFPSRYCAACLPAALDEANTLERLAGSLLAERAELRSELQLQRDTECELEAQLTERAAAAAYGAQDGEAGGRVILELVAQLRTLELDAEARARLDEVRLSQMSGREERAAARFAEASSRMEEATVGNRQLHRHLARADRAVEVLLAERSRS